MRGARLAIAAIMHDAMARARWAGLLALAGLTLGSPGCGITDGRSCWVSDRLYADGATFRDADGCNGCTCNDGVVSCTLKQCVKLCGGDAGLTCGPREFCAPISGDCGSTDSARVCQPRPDRCPDLYAPVCGCDGKTYSSSCEAAAQGVNISSDGPCKEPKPCGGFAGSQCSDNEYCAYEGDCGIADRSAVCKVRPSACDASYDPVCGCDGKTYGNTCLAAVAGFGYLHRGACEAPSGSCRVGDVVYPSGATGIPAPDGCNTCSCDTGALSCTKRACSDSACVVNGQIYPNGSSGVPDPESCNMCTCSDGAVSGCTEIHCPLPASCRLGRAIYQSGKGFVSSDGSTSCVCQSGQMVCTAIP